MPRVVDFRAVSHQPIAAPCGSCKVGAPPATTAVKLLRCSEHLCRADAPLGVSALAARLRLTKSNAHRILRTLTGLGYAQQTADGSTPTLKAWELGTLVINRLDFVQIAKLYLNELNVTTGESAYLATLNGSSVVYLDVLESRYRIRIRSVIGGSAPAHCSASGKLLLAYNPLIAGDLYAKPLEKYTARTLTNIADLERKFEAIAAMATRSTTGNGWKAYPACRPVAIASAARGQRRQLASPH